MARTAPLISHRPPRSPVAGPAAILLFLLTVGSFFLPWGAFWSIYQGLDRGTGICAHPGCFESPTVFAEYPQPMRENERVGYCQAHAGEAPQTISITRGKSISVAVSMVFMVGPAIYLLWFVISLGDVFRSEPKALERFGYFVVGGLVGINVLSYGFWHYCFLGFRHSGW